MRGGGVAEELVGLPTERKMYSLTFVLMLNIKFQVPTSSGSLVLTQTKGVTVRGITLQKSDGIQSKVISTLILNNILNFRNLAQEIARPINDV